MAGSKKVAPPSSPPPPPPGCSDRPRYPILSKKTKGYEEAVVCAQWKQDADTDHDRFIITPTPADGHMPPVYEVILESDTEHPPTHGEPPIFEGTAYFGCKGRDTLKDAPAQTIRVPARRRETERAAIHRLEGAANKIKAIDGCPSPRFLSFFLLTDGTRPTGKPAAKK